MDRSNLDVYAIQKYPEELSILKEVLQKEDDLILYTDLFCDFQIGNKNIETKQFNAALESKANDALILFQTTDEVSLADIEAYLSNYFKYHKVSFLGEDISTKSDDIKPFIWLARNQSVLEEAIYDTLKQGSNDCDFYPYVGGKCDLKYCTNDYQTYYLVDGRTFRGVLKMGDKLVLLTRQNELENVTVDQVFRLMQKYNMDCHYYECGEPDLSYFERKTSKVN